MKCNIIVLSLLCINFCACDKDENNNSNNFATGIVELPALRNGANDVFVTHCTTFNGQKVTSFSMEYDKSKKHSRWLLFDSIIKLDCKGQLVAIILFRTLLLIWNISVLKQILGEKVMIEGTSVLPLIDFINKMLTTRPFIIQI